MDGRLMDSLFLYILHSFLSVDSLILAVQEFITTHYQNRIYTLYSCVSIPKLQILLDFDSLMMRSLLFSFFLIVDSSGCFIALASRPALILATHGQHFNIEGMYMQRRRKSFLLHATYFQTAFAPKLRSPVTCIICGNQKNDFAIFVNAK
jgi:hypothetical protein